MINNVKKYLLTFTHYITEEEVRFERHSVTFLENSGNQSIFLVLEGGALLQDLIVTIYDINTGENNIIRLIDTAACIYTTLYTTNYNPIISISIPYPV